MWVVLGAGLSHLGVVDVAALGHGALSVHQEAVPPPLFRQGIFVALCDVAVQLALPAADGLHVLRDREGGVRRAQNGREAHQVSPSHEQR